MTLNLLPMLMKSNTDAREKYIPYTFDFIRVKSYEGTSSTGNVEITNIDVSSLHGKHVLFVEDIIDTGLTMSRLLAYLNDQIKPASIRYESMHYFDMIHSFLFGCDTLCGVYNCTPAVLFTLRSF